MSGLSTGYCSQTEIAKSIVSKRPRVLIKRMSLTAALTVSETSPSELDPCPCKRAASSIADQNRTEEIFRGIASLRCVTAAAR